MLVAVALVVGISGSAASHAGAADAPHIGAIAVTPGAQPGSYALTWGSTAPPDGYAFDVQLKSSGNPAWTFLESGTTAQGGTFTPTVKGPYALRAQLRSLTDQPDSAWSPTLTLRGDWPMYRYNARHSGATDDPTIGASNASGLTLKWETNERTTQRWSSPAVAFNATLGKALVYAGTQTGGFSARDVATGHAVWTNPKIPGILSSPAVYGDTVYVGTRADQMMAIDATTGALRCKFTVTGVVLSSPVVGTVDATGPLVFFGDSGRFDGDVGHEWAMTGVGNSAGPCRKRWVFSKWKNPGPDGKHTSSWSPPALITQSVARPLLVFGSSDPDDCVYALDPRSGAKVWTFQSTPKSPDDDVGAAPTISPPGVNGFAHGVVYVAAKDKTEYAIDLAHGTLIWLYDLRGGASGARANSQSGSVLVGKRVIVSYSRYVFSLDAITGKKVWRSIRAGNDYFASPVVSGAAGDRVAFISDSGGVMHAFRLDNGSQAFRLGTGKTTYSSAAIAYGGVFFTSDTGHLYALG